MEQPAGYANPSESLLSMLRQLQKDHVELKASFLKLNEDHTAKTERCEAAEAKLTHWRGEAERLIELNQAKERVVEQYAQLLALHEPESTAVTIRSSAQDTSWQIPGVEQRLAKKEAEVAAMRSTVDDMERLGALVPELQVELEAQRIATKRAESKAAPLEARVGECYRRQNELRDQLGKSELDRQRQSTQFQSELSGAAKRLRAARGQNEQLLRQCAQPSQCAQQPQPPPQALVNSGSSRGMANAFRPSCATSSMFGAGLRQHG